MTNITTCREKRVISRRRGGKSNNITSNNAYKRIILCLEFFAHKHTSRISKLLQKNNNSISILKRDTKYSYKLKNYSICCWPTLKNSNKGHNKVFIQWQNNNNTFHYSLVLVVIYKNRWFYYSIQVFNLKIMT